MGSVEIYTTSNGPNGDGIPKDRLVIFVKRSAPTSTQNTIKPIILLHELNISYHTHVLSSPENEAWFYDWNPYGQVPAMEDSAIDSPSERFRVFESSACLLYLADKYDSEGVFSGKTGAEKAAVTNWLCAYTAGLGPAGKFWHLLHLKAAREPGAADDFAPAISYFRIMILEHYQRFDKQLAKEGQGYIALKDRPTIADYAILPFATEQLAATADISFNNMPHLRDWSRKLLQREAVKSAMERVQTFV